MKAKFDAKQPEDYIDDIDLDEMLDDDKITMESEIFESYVGKFEDDWLEVMESKDKKAAKENIASFVKNVYSVLSEITGLSNCRCPDVELNEEDEDTYYNSELNTIYLNLPKTRDFSDMLDLKFSIYSEIGHALRFDCKGEFACKDIASLKISTDCGDVYIANCILNEFHDGLLSVLGGAIEANEFVEDQLKDYSKLFTKCIKDLVKSAKRIYPDKIKDLPEDADLFAKLAYLTKKGIRDCRVNDSIAEHLAMCAVLPYLLEKGIVRKAKNGNYKLEGDLYSNKLLSELREAVYMEKDEILGYLKKGLNMYFGGNYNLETV